MAYLIMSVWFEVFVNLKEKSTRPYLVFILTEKRNSHDSWTVLHPWERKKKPLPESGPSG